MHLVKQDDDLKSIFESMRDSYRIAPDALDDFKDYENLEALHYAREKCLPIQNVHNSGR